MPSRGAMIDSSLRRAGLSASGIAPRMRPGAPVAPSSGDIVSSSSAVVAVVAL